MIARSSTAAILLVIGAAGCRPTGLQPGEGYIAVPGGNVWYRIVGSGNATPLLVLHGGPGAPSYYLKPFAALADERPVVFYDQLGAGHSDPITDTTLLTVERFVAELAAVREALGLDEVHILGHSWGTMLATDYLLTKPRGVRSVIFASPAISIPRWLADADTLLMTMPDSIQAAVARHEADGTFADPEYQAAVMAFYRRYVGRKLPWSADVDSTFTQLSMMVYGHMWGPSEFTATGTLQDYDRTDRLHEITIPTLFTTGRYDEARPQTVEYYQSLIPGAALAIFENSAHLTMQDEPAENVWIVREFLRTVERR
ncbi:MAG: proline iminopeptidase-family hydrolase [Gemmatimonadota bacterium]|nr:proline iminopeptidase-family hydrolase [Gemmatimonadota bacterium]MDH4349872.1 proline iminopeptidase-family hydrolase [Gemmatimonadota bacterium]MDH5198048.1 proline iminopeptidase-family hydrolase [Gemmatimonadota bacterium]